MELENLSFIKNSELRNSEILFIYLFKKKEIPSYYFNKYTTISLTSKFPFRVFKRCSFQISAFFLAHFEYKEDFGEI